MAKEALDTKSDRFKKAMAKRDACIAKGMKPEEADDEFKKAFDEDDEGVDAPAVEKALNEVTDMLKGASVEKFKEAVEAAVAEQKKLHGESEQNWRAGTFESFKLMAVRQNELFKGLVKLTEVVEGLAKSVTAQTDLVKSLQAPKADAADALNKGGAVADDKAAAALDAATKPQAAEGSKQALPAPGDAKPEDALNKSLTVPAFIDKAMDALQKGMDPLKARDVSLAVAKANAGVPLSELRQEVGHLIGL